MRRLFSLLFLIGFIGCSTQMDYDSESQSVSQFGFLSCNNAYKPPPRDPVARPKVVYYHFDYTTLPEDTDFWIVEHNYPVVQPRAVGELLLPLAIQEEFPIPEGRVDEGLKSLPWPAARTGYGITGPIEADNVLRYHNDIQVDELRFGGGNFAVFPLNPAGGVNEFNWFDSGYLIWYDGVYLAITLPDEYTLAVFKLKASSPDCDPESTPPSASRRRPLDIGVLSFDHPGMFQRITGGGAEQLIWIEIHAPWQVTGRALIVASRQRFSIGGCLAKERSIDDRLGGAVYVARLDMKNRRVFGGHIGLRPSIATQIFGIMVAGTPPGLISED